MEAALHERPALPPPNALDAKVDALISLIAQQNATQMQQFPSVAQHVQDPKKAQVEPDNAPSLPIMRTMTGCMELLRKDDPDSGLTMHALRELVLSGKVPYVRCGVKYLVNYGKLLEYLATCAVQEQDDKPSGTIQRVKE